MLVSIKFCYLVKSFIPLSPPCHNNNNNQRDYKIIPIDPFLTRNKNNGRHQSIPGPYLFETYIQQLVTKLSDIIILHSLISTLS